MIIRLLSIYLFLQVSLLANIAIKLTTEEKEWLINHPHMTVGIDKNYAPFEFQDKDGEFKGIAIDYIKEIEKILNIKFNIVTEETWIGVTDLAKNKSLDILSCVAKTTERAKYLTFTEPYLSFPMAIVTNKSIGYIDGLKELNGKTVAVVDQYMANQVLEEHYKDILLVKIQNLIQGLELVSSGKTFAYVDNLSQILYVLQKENFYNLTVAGITEYKFNYAMGIRSDEPILKDILQKSIDAIPHEVKDNIYCKWFPRVYKQIIDYSMIWKILILISCIMCIFAYWLHKLKQAIKARILIEKKLIRNQEWLNCSLNSANIGALDWNIVSGEITINSIFANLLDIPKDETSLSMENFKKEFVYPDDLKLLLKHQEECFSNIDGFNTTRFRLISKLGVIKLVESNNKVFQCDGYSNPIRIIGFIREISENEPNLSPSSFLFGHNSIQHPDTVI